MPYMIYQQVTTAVKEAYKDREDLAELHAAARSCREWLAALEIDGRLREPIVEPVAAIEEALKDLLKMA